MANAARKPNPLEYQTQRAIILRRADEDVIRILKGLQKDVQDMLREIASRPAGIGRTIREAQLRLVQRNLHAELGKAWREIGNVAQARRYEAAVRSASYAQEANAFRLVTGGVQDGGIIAENIFESEVANAASGIDRMIARQSGASYVPLSERVYNSEVGIGSKVDKLVNSALARGLSAIEFAKEVRQFVNPLTPGGVSYAAKRLARTEINNAAHAMSVEAMREVPWCDGMKWHLSGSHGRPDICDQYASGGPNNDGVYPKTSTPTKPHPQCLCFVTPDLADDDEFERNLLSGKYNQYLERYRNIQPGQVVKTSYGGFSPPVTPKPKAVTPTKVGQAPKKTAKPPSRAKPPAPGSAPRPTGAASVQNPFTVTSSGGTLSPGLMNEAERLAQRFVSQNTSMAKARNFIAKEFNITKEEAEAIVRRVASSEPGSVAARQANLTAVKPPKVATTPAKPTAAPKPARVTTASEDAIRDWVPRSLPETNVLPDLSSKLPLEIRQHINGLLSRIGREERSILERELQHQASLVPGPLRGLDSVRVEVDARVRDSVVNGYYHHPADFANRTRKDEMVLSDRIFKRGYGEEQLQSEQTGFKSSCGAQHTGAQSVTAHEFGHHVDWMIHQSAIDRREIDALWHDIADTLGARRPVTSQIEDLQDWFFENKDLIRRKVSTYATTNEKEFFAEVWREFSGNPNARPQIKHIGQHMQDLANRAVK